jgi:hypothetical protein
VREFLEKNWLAALVCRRVECVNVEGTDFRTPLQGEREAVRLTIKALLEVVDSGSKNMVCLLTTVRMLLSIL